MKIGKVKTVVLDPELMVEKTNKWNIHVLIQSILNGEDHDETPDQWRARIESYAVELEREIYREVSA